MSEKANHFKVGVFVLTGLALFVGALFAMGLGRFFVKGDLFETYVPGGVENLALGAPVKLRGVAIGKVTAIGFIGKEQPQYKEQAVRIVFEVSPEAGVVRPGENVQQMLDTEVALGLRARIQGQGLFGPSIISLEYAESKILPGGDEPLDGEILLHPFGAEPDGACPLTRWRAPSSARRTWIWLHCWPARKSSSRRPANRLVENDQSD